MSLAPSRHRFLTMAAVVAAHAAAGEAPRAPDVRDWFFRDDFSGGPRSWAIQRGRWSVEGEALRVGGAGGLVTRQGPALGDIAFGSDVRVEANERRAGLLLRASNAGTGDMDGYFVALRRSSDRTRVELIRISRGAWLTLQDPAVAGIAPDAFCRIRVLASGSSIWVYADDMNRPIIAEHDTTRADGAIGLMAEGEATFDNASAAPLPDRLPPPPSTRSWGWVKGAVFFPSRYVNSVQLWQEYDPALVERELHYAAVYGLNAVSVYLNYLVWRDTDRRAFLRNVEDMLSRAERHGLGVSLVFFDQCGNEPPHLAPQNPPVRGLHNARFMRSPGREIVADPVLYESEKAGLRQYVLDVVNAHADDPRIFLWQAVNEPLEDAMEKLAADAYGWIKSTGTTIPVASTASSFLGGRWSDIYTLHVYLPKGPPPYDLPVFGYLAGGEHLCTETLNRPYLSLPKLVDAFGPAGVGWIAWELMIGALNTRWEWGSPRGAAEPAEPFHGLVYPDGHPWSLDDVRKILGTEDLSGLPVFDVEYYGDTEFRVLLHRSVTPRIDFDLFQNWGTGSPDPQHGVPEDGFSIRWKGRVLPPKTGTYVFHVESDETARLFVGGRLVVSKGPPRGEASGAVELSGGVPQELVVEYVDTSGDTNMHVSWSGPGFGKTFLPGRR